MPPANFRDPSGNQKARWRDRIPKGIGPRPALPQTNHNARLHEAGGRSGEMTDAKGSVELRLADAADGAETLLEFVDAAFGVHKLRQSGEERVGVGGDAD